MPAALGTTLRPATSLIVLALHHCHVHGIDTVRCRHTYRARRRLSPERGADGYLFTRAELAAVTIASIDTTHSLSTLRGLGYRSTARKTRFRLAATLGRTDLKPVGSERRFPNAVSQPHVISSPLQGFAWRTYGTQSECNPTRTGRDAVSSRWRFSSGIVLPLHRRGATRASAPFCEVRAWPRRRTTQSSRSALILPPA
jgi:hypothetical protein